MLGGYSYVAYDDIKPKKIDDFIAKNNLEIVEMNPDEVQDFLEGIRRFNYKGLMSTFINEDFNEKMKYLRALEQYSYMTKVEELFTIIG